MSSSSSAFSVKQSAQDTVSLSTCASMDHLDQTLLHTAQSVTSSSISHLSSVEVFVPSSVSTVPSDLSGQCSPALVSPNTSETEDSAAWRYLNEHQSVYRLDWGKTASEIPSHRYRRTFLYHQRSAQCCPLARVAPVCLGHGQSVNWWLLVFCYSSVYGGNHF